ncbi:unnamed protein product, partial [Prorocentrum cordatum]
MAVESASPLWLLPARMSRLLACRGGCGLLVHSEAAGPRGREYGKFAGFCCLRCKEAQGAGDHGKKCEHQQAPDGTPRFGEEAPLRDGHAEQHGVKHYRGEVGGQVVTVIVCEDPRHKHVQFALGWAEEARHLWGEELPERGTREVWPGCNAAQPGDERLCAVVPDGPKVFGLGGSLLSPPSADASQSARASTRSSGRAPSTSPLRSTARPRSRRGSAPGAFQRSCGICRRRRCRRPPCRGRRRAMPPALGRAREAAWRRRSAGRRGRSTARPRGAAPPRQSGGPRPRGGRWSRPRGPSPTATVHSAGAAPAEAADAAESAAGTEKACQVPRSPPPAAAAPAAAGALPTTAGSAATAGARAGAMPGRAPRRRGRPGAAAASGATAAAAAAPRRRTPGGPPRARRRTPCCASSTCWRAPSWRRSRTKAPARAASATSSRSSAGHTSRTWRGHAPWAPSRSRSRTGLPSRSRNGRRRPAPPRRARGRPPARREA